MFLYQYGLFQHKKWQDKALNYANVFVILGFWHKKAEAIIHIRQNRGAKTRAFSSFTKHLQTTFALFYMQNWQIAGGIETKKEPNELTFSSLSW